MFKKFQKYFVVKTFEFTQERYQSLLDILKQHKDVMEADLVRFERESKHAADDHAKSINSLKAQRENQLKKVDDLLSHLNC